MELAVLQLTEVCLSRPRVTGYQRGSGHSLCELRSYTAARHQGAIRTFWPRSRVSHFSLIDIGCECGESPVRVSSPPASYTRSHAGAPNPATWAAGTHLHVGSQEALTPVCVLNKLNTKRICETEQTLRSRPVRLLPLVAQSDITGQDEPGLGG